MAQTSIQEHIQKTQDTHTQTLCLKTRKEPADHGHRWEE